MSVDENITVYRRLIDAVASGNPATLDELVAPDFVDHNPIPGQGPGLEGLKQWQASICASFPDLYGTVEDVLGADDKVAGRIAWHGTHKGVFAGAAPTGKRVTIEAMHIVRIRDGKVTEWWGVADIAGALSQISAS